MPNTCTICKHPDREQIEDALARGLSLRNIASQFGVGYQAVNRHQICTAAELKALKASHTTQLNETLLERLSRYRLIAEKHLNNDEKALLALDRCYKQLDIEAKLTGAYQKKQENQPDCERHSEIVFEAYKLVLSRRTFDESVAMIRPVYEARNEVERDAAIRAAIEADTEAVEAVWSEAERRVNLRESTMIH
jgi:hypothetical protein